MAAKIPDNELDRLSALLKLHILDTDEDEAYDSITRIAANVMETPIALISLVDSDRQWFKSKIGMKIQETPREYSFCAHAILNPHESMLVTDASKDERFAKNPYVDGREGSVRFYFGTPLITTNNHAIGTICIVDNVVRAAPTPVQISSLKELSKLVMSLLDMREFIIRIREQVVEFDKYKVVEIQSEEYGQMFKKLNSQCDEILQKIKARKIKEAREAKVIVVEEAKAAAQEIKNTAKEVAKDLLKNK